MERVLVGLSGGVDSAVSAYLLKKANYEVVGISFRFIDSFDSNDAKRVAEMLDIEFHEVDYRDEFKKIIIDQFISDYENGITPNPCARCNRFVKMNYLYKEMENYNCDFIATGHYARNDHGKIYRSVDLFKDQTYFLSLVPQHILNKTLFPLEGINKEEVRSIAEKIGLEVYNKKDSTDVCFIDNKFNEYMKSSIKATSGDIINISNNKKLGTHNGLPFYTIGQRKGLNIGGTENRLFVVGKDIKKNILYVAESIDNDYLISNECIIDNVNLIGPHHPTFATVKFRYKSKEIPVTIEYISEDEIKLTYVNGANSVTPGQVAALYLGNECIGGGIIKNVMKNGEKLWYL